MRVEPVPCPECGHDAYLVEDRYECTNPDCCHTWEPTERQLRHEYRRVIV